MPEPQIRVLILHGNVLTSELISRELSRQQDICSAYHASTVAEATEQIQREKIDVVLISSKFRDGGPLGAIERLHDTFPDVRFVLLMSDPDRAMLVAAFRMGVRGVFHSRKSGFDTLLKCVRCVHAGQIWASSAELEVLMTALQHPAPEEPEHKDVLTNREKDVVRLLGAGMTNRDIAHQLRLSEHTVKNYMFRIFDKVGVSSRVELLLYAMHHVTLDPDDEVSVQSAPAEYARAS